MSNEAEDQVTVPDSEQERAVSGGASEGEALNTEHLSEFAEWLEARFDRLDNRFQRFDQTGTRNTRQVTEDMVDLRTAVSHLNERVGQSISGNHKVLREVLQAEIRAALKEDRNHMARLVRRRTLRLLTALLIVAIGLGFAALWALDMLPLR